MQKCLLFVPLVLAACHPAPPKGEAPPPEADTASIPAAANEQRSLQDLNALTFDCPRAGLNAAAREAAKTPTQGTYQFSYFKILSDSHHSAYEVHFKSNYPDEPELKYCVSVYCQQGWDPRTSKMNVRLMNAEPLPHKAAAGGVHGGMQCGEQAKVEKSRAAKRPAQAKK